MRGYFSTGSVLLGWVLYGIALACPAVVVLGGQTWSGAKCLGVTICFPFWPLAPQLMAFAAVNLSLFFSLLVFFAGGGLERRVFGLLSTVCCLLTLLAPFSVEQMMVGGYLWMMSAFCISIGCSFAVDHEERKSAV